MSRFWSFFKKLKLTFLNYHVKKYVCHSWFSLVKRQICFKFVYISFSNITFERTFLKYLLKTKDKIVKVALISS